MVNKLIEKITKFCEYAENKDLKLAIDFLQEEVEETKKAVETNDAEEIIDGFADCAFVAINGIYKFFRQDQGQSELLARKNTLLALTRVANANMSKASETYPSKYKDLQITPIGDGRFFFKKNGKVIKPDGWQVPTYDDLYNKK